VLRHFNLTLRKGISMNLLVKSAVGSALALVAVGANALGIPATNSSDLVLVIQSVTTPANVYVLDTGISLNTAMSGTLVTDAVLNTSLAGVNATIGPSGTLTAFLAANPLSGDAWSLEGGQYSATGPTLPPVNSNTKVAGKAFGVFTSVNVPANVGGIQLPNFQGFLGGLQGDATTPIDGMGIKPLVSCGALCDFSSGVSASTTGGTPASSKYAIFGSAVDDRSTAIGSSIALYGITGDGSTGTVESYILGSAKLSSNGTLTLTGNGTTTAPVPLPAAVWLFGSGLMGLVGVSRRRKAAV
jgi:hypothetical protein